MNNDSNIKEIVVITVSKEYYHKHIDVFKNSEVKVKSVFVEGEDHEGDEMHKMLMKSYIKAQKELRNYEFDKRYKKHRD